MTVKRGSRLPVFLTVMIVCLLTQTGVAQDSTGLGMVAGYQSIDACGGIERYNDYYYLASQRTGLVVLHKEGDVFSRVYQNTDFEEPPQGVFRDGDRLLVTGFYDKTIFDISSPGNPVLLAHYDFDWDNAVSYNFPLGNTKWCNGILVHRQFRGNEITVERMSEDAEPQLLHTNSLVIGSSSYRCPSVTGSLISTLVSDDGECVLRIWDYSDPEDIRVVVDGLDVGVLSYAVSDSWVVSVENYSLLLYDIRNRPTILDFTYPVNEDYDESDVRFIQIVDNYFMVYVRDYIYCYCIEDNMIELDGVYDNIGMLPSVNDIDEYGVIYNSWLKMVEVTIDDSYSLDIASYNLREIFEGPFLVADDHILTADLKAYCHAQEDQLDSVGVFFRGEEERGRLVAVKENIGLVTWEDYDNTFQFIVEDPESESGFCIQDTIRLYPCYGAFVFGENHLLYHLVEDREFYTTYLTVMEIDDSYTLTAIDSTEFPVGLEYNDQNIIYNDHYLYYLERVQGEEDRKLISINVENPHDMQLEYQDLPTSYLYCTIKASEDLLLVNNYNIGAELDEIDHCIADSSFVYSISAQAPPALIDTLRIPVGNQAEYRGGYLLVPNGQLQVYRYNPWSNEEPELVAEWGERYVREALFLEDDRILATWENGMGLFAFDPTGIHEIEISESLPSQLRLSSYPNPANPETRITLELPQAEAVMVCVYDVLGREVVRLHEGVLHAGSHAFHFGSQPGLSSGVYFVRATAGKWETAQRIVLLK